MNLLNAFKMLRDEDGKEIAKFINPETGIYRVKLEVNHKYKIKIKLQLFDEE